MWYKLRKKFNFLLVSIIIVLLSFPKTVFADRGIVKYQGESNYPPYKYLNKGQYTGFDINLTNLIFRNKDYTVDFSNDSFERVYEKLKNNEIDTCGLLVINNERKKDILYSRPVLTIYTAAYTRKNFQHITLQNMKYFNIGVGKGQYSEEVIKNELKINDYKTFENIGAAVDALLNKEIDILFENQEVINYLIIEKGLKDEIIHQEKDLYPRKVAYGISKENAGLLKYVNERMDVLIKTGVYEELYQKYFFNHSDLYKAREKRNLSIFIITLILCIITIYLLIKKYIRYLRNKISKEQEFSSTVLNEANMFILAINIEGIITKLNKYAANLMKIHEHEMLGKPYKILLEKDKNLFFIEEILESIKRDIPLKNEKSISIISNYKKHEFIFKTSLINKKDSYEVVFIGFDITERIEYELILQKNYQDLEASFEEITALEEELREKYNELSISQVKLEELVYKDSLTGLPNRECVYYKFNNDFIHETNCIDKGALIFIDMDNFKYINDTMGHSFGDSLIISIGERLSKKADDNRFLARLGGDEFIFCLKNDFNIEEIEEFSRKILHSFNQPFHVEGINIQVTISMGISIFPQDGITIHELLKKSDLAMYKSKYEGKNRFTFFNESMNDEMVERMEIETQLRNALLNDEFQVYYQPQIHINSGKIIGFEALIRWNNSKLGFVSPEKFIKIAEENHMIIDIGAWVVETACNFIKEAHRKGYDDCYISVNISVIQLIQEDFVQKILQILDDINLNPNYLELEITESIYIEHFDNIFEKLNQLRKKGITIALDDFGKGYSSLSYLRQLPMDILKIDKCFIDDIESKEGEALVENIIIIGHKMNLNIVAEGVETVKQHEYLKEFKCDKLQGYLFSKPLPEEAAMDLLK